MSVPATSPTISTCTSNAFESCSSTRPSSLRGTPRTCLKGSSRINAWRLPARCKQPARRAKLIASTTPPPELAIGSNSTPPLQMWKSASVLPRRGTKFTRNVYPGNSKSRQPCTQLATASSSCFCTCAATSWRRINAFFAVTASAESFTARAELSTYCLCASSRLAMPCARVNLIESRLRTAPP